MNNAEEVVVATKALIELSWVTYEHAMEQGFSESQAMLLASKLMVSMLSARKESTDEATY